MLKNSVKNKVLKHWDDEGILFSTSEDLTSCLETLKEKRGVEKVFIIIVKDGYLLNKV